MKISCDGDQYSTQPTLLICAASIGTKSRAFATRTCRRMKYKTSHVHTPAPFQLEASSKPVPRIMTKGLCWLHSLPKKTNPIILLAQIKRAARIEVEKKKKKK